MNDIFELFLLYFILIFAKKGQPEIAKLQEPFSQEYPNDLYYIKRKVSLLGFERELYKELYGDDRGWSLYIECYTLGNQERIIRDLFC